MGVLFGRLGHLVGIQEEKEDSENRKEAVDKEEENSANELSKRKSQEIKTSQARIKKLPSNSNESEAGGFIIDRSKSPPEIGDQASRLPGKFQELEQKFLLRCQRRGNSTILAIWKMNYLQLMTQRI